MIHNKIKKILAIVMILFSLLNFTNPLAASTSFEVSSDKVLDIDADSESDNDETEEKNIFISFSAILFPTILTCKLKPLYSLYLHDYHNNSSLFKPPIFS